MASFEDDIPVTDRFRVVSDGCLVVYLVVWGDSR